MTNPQSGDLVLGGKDGNQSNLVLPKTGAMVLGGQKIEIYPASFGLEFNKKDTHYGNYLPNVKSSSHFGTKFIGYDSEFIVNPGLINQAQWKQKIRGFGTAYRMYYECLPGLPVSPTEFCPRIATIEGNKLSQSLYNNPEKLKFNYWKISNPFVKNNKAKKDFPLTITTPCNKIVVLKSVEFFIQFNKNFSDWMDDLRNDNYRFGEWVKSRPDCAPTPICVWMLKGYFEGSRKLVNVHDLFEEGSKPEIDLRFRLQTS